MAAIAVTARGQRTREALIAAGRSVFERDGFLAARITDISSAARVAHGTFYTHFATKEDLFREVATILLPEMSTETPVYEFRGREQAIRGIIRATRRYLENYRRNASLMGVVEQVATFDADVQAILTSRSRAYLARTEAQIVGLQRAAVVSATMDAYCMANVLGSMVSRFAHAVYVDNSVIDRSIDFDVSVQTLTLAWANAVGLRTDADELAGIYGSTGTG